MSISVIPFYTPEESLRLINRKWKLTGQNFPVWKMHLDSILRAQEILSLKLRKDRSVKEHLIEMRRLFKCLTRLGYKMAQEELVYLMWYSLPKEICDTTSAYMKEPKTDVAKVHEDILASLEPKPAPADLMDTDWIDELGDLSFPECGRKDICEHSMNIDQIEIGLPDAPATPVNGLYTVNLQDNNNEIYHISKRSKDIEDQTYLWHCRLGHINKKRVELLLKGGFLGTFDYKPFDNCESCLSGKMTKQPFNKENERAADLLEIIHADVCGPFSHVARGGYWYFITFTDDFSRYGYVYLMRHKSESFERFREYQNEVQNQLGRKIKFLRSDRGGEYLSDEFDNHLMECGIVSQLTPPYTPQMNGVSERRNRTLLDMGHALETAAHILNRAPTKSVENTPYELWKSKKPKMSFLRIWGCEVYVKRPTSEKLKPKSDKCIFVGYPRTTVGYYFYNPEENKVFVARNGKFLEEKFLSSGNTRKDVELQIVDENDTTPTVEPEIQHENVEPQSESIEEVQTQDLRRSSRVRQEPDRYLGFLITQSNGDLNEPISYGEAVSGNESEQWQEAMKAEMQSMYENQVWELEDLPQHCKVVGHKWVFKKKTDMDGNVHTYKARLVAKGFTQTHGIDYDETFLPVAMLKSIRILMAISAYFNYEIWQMDVKTAFLNGKLTEDVYMQQPEGFVDPKNPDKVEFEPCVYTKFSGSTVTFLVLYVDDILLIGNNVPTLQSVKNWLSKCFQMKDLGEAAYILGIKIYRNRSKQLIGLSQSTYIDKILKKFRMDESKKGFIPMQHGIVLSKTQCPVSSQDQDKMRSVSYASAIGSIMYAMLCTRPDVAYLVSVTSRYQQNPGEPHWVAVKNVLKYLKRTKDMFLVFGGSEDEISVTGYSDASFQTDRDDFRSHSKQDTIADSTTEAEYIAASDATKEVVWLRNFLSDLRVVASVSRPIDIFCDNSGAVAQAKEPREHHKSRHVLRKYHLIREMIGRGDTIIFMYLFNFSAPVPTNLHSHASSVPLLNGTNFSEWRENVEFTLGVLDLDLALTSEKPPELNDKSTKEDKELHKLWEKSNRLSLMFMRMTISANIKSSLPTKELAKDFMNAVAERFKTADKSVAGNLMAQLTTMKFDGTRSMYDHVTEMQNISTKLNDLGISVTETFLVTFILNSLPEQYAPFQMHYNTHEANWTVDGTQGAHHKFGKKAGRGQKRAPPRMNDNVQPTQQKAKKDEKCRFCKTTKHTKKGAKRSSQLLEIIHTDICGPFDVPTFGGENYFITFIDDYSRYCYLYLLHNKSQSVNAVEAFITEVERQLEKKVKIIRSDRGGEFYGRYDETGQHPGPFAKLLEKLGIAAQYTTPGSPWQNGVAERRNRTLLEMVRSMMSHANLPVSLWTYAFRMAVYILNRVPSKAVPKTPFELWKGWKPSLKHLEVWGCAVEAKAYNPDERKLDMKTISGYFIGFPEKSKGYIVYCPNHKLRIIETGNVKFIMDGMISGSTFVEDKSVHETRVTIPLPIKNADKTIPSIVEPHNNEGSLVDSVSNYVQKLTNQTTHPML
ncbi:hypothetical protein OSB04_012991 [Centaurea solstitialis]|uniref:Integrase catalytic domain-containing protein n=1 Tax=Centaurea solstitialis TaxID=347529 RepID=A0AA38WF33_9ASTR|nr:hypothetical protein OSB04_012991 [Centaurea solstitialis]